MAKFRRKGTFKKILAGALAVVLGVGAIAGVSALAQKSDDDMKSISPKFSVGGLTSIGTYEKSDATIYTKDAFECQGLIAKLEFDSSINYELFFYDVAGNFLESTGKLDVGFSDELPYEASYARVEITPIWADDVKESDRVVKWYNVHEYSKQLNLEVLKEQVVDRTSYSETLNEEATAVVASLIGGTGTYNLQTDSFNKTNDHAPWYWYGKVDAGDFSEIIFKVKTSSIGKPSDYVENYEMLLLYDTENKTQGNISKFNPTVLKTEGSYSYLSVPATTIGEFIFTLDYELKDGLTIWLK